MAPLPKRRRSKSKQRSRQAHWAIKPVNLSETEPALAIVSRNDPNEHENVIAYDETEN